MRCCSITVRSFSRGSRPNYVQRLSLALEHGYSVEDNKYFWLYKELDLRARAIRQITPLPRCTPKFMGTATGEESMGYAAEVHRRLLQGRRNGSEDRRKAHRIRISMTVIHTGYSSRKPTTISDWIMT